MRDTTEFRENPTAGSRAAAVPVEDRDLNACDVGQLHVCGVEEPNLCEEGALNACDVRELIAVALADEDPDGPTRWKAVGLLHTRGDLETFTEARRLCASDSSAERVLGVDILGELGAPGRPFVDKTLSVLRYLAASDDDVRVLHSVLIAFGHLRDQRALPSVVELSTHPDATVRYGAVYALTHVAGRPPAPAGLAALRRLAHDPDEDVADWAALGLLRP